MLISAHWRDPLWPGLSTPLSHSLQQPCPSVLPGCLMGSVPGKPLQVPSSKAVVLNWVDFAPHHTRSPAPGWGGILLCLETFLFVTSGRVVASLLSSSVWRPGGCHSPLSAQDATRNDRSASGKCPSGLRRETLLSGNTCSPSAASENVGNSVLRTAHLTAGLPAGFYSLGHSGAVSAPGNGISRIPPVVRASESPCRFMRSN